LEQAFGLAAFILSLDLVTWEVLFAESEFLGSTYAGLVFCLLFFKVFLD
jgi:hypothetical protein